jgi:hypothetical protein
LDVGVLTEALEKDAIDLYGKTSDRREIIMHFGMLLEFSQSNDFVDLTALHSEVCTVIAERYAGVMILLTAPFVFKRRTWEALFYRSRKTFTLWGDVVDVFFHLFETPPETRATIALAIANRSAGETSTTFLAACRGTIAYKALESVNLGLDLGLFHGPFETHSKLLMYPTSWMCIGMINAFNIQSESFTLCCAMRLHIYMVDFFKPGETRGWVCELIEHLCTVRPRNFTLAQFRFTTLNMTKNTKKQVAIHATMNAQWHCSLGGTHSEENLINRPIGMGGIVRLFGDALSIVSANERALETMSLGKRKKKS